MKKAGNQSLTITVLVEKEPEEFKVNKGRNVVGLDIFLREGASISGRVFGPDGKNPITNGHVVVDPRLKGKLVENILDKQGRYKVVGLGALRQEEYQYYVLIRAFGFSNLTKTLILKNGEKLENYDVAIGKGEVHIKGTIRSSTANKAVRGAEVYISDVERDRLDRSDGSTITDESGNYSIIGFSNPGTVEISIIHEDYKMIEDVRKSLKRGINMFEFKLIPKSKEKSRESDSFFLDLTSRRPVRYLLLNSFPMAVCVWSIPKICTVITLLAVPVMNGMVCICSRPTAFDCALDIMIKKCYYGY